MAGTLTAEILLTPLRMEADQEWIWELSNERQALFCLHGLLTFFFWKKKKSQTTKHELMWAFAGKAACRTRGTRFAEWMFPLYLEGKPGALRRGFVQEVK